MDFHLGEAITSPGIAADVADRIRCTIGKQVIIHGRLALVMAIAPDPATPDRFRVTARYLVTDTQPPSAN